MNDMKYDMKRLRHILSTLLVLLLGGAGQAWAQAVDPVNFGNYSIVIGTTPVTTYDQIDTDTWYVVSGPGTAKNYWKIDGKVLTTSNLTYPAGGHNAETYTAFMFRFPDKTNNGWQWLTSIMSALGAPNDKGDGRLSYLKNADDNTGQVTLTDNIISYEIWRNNINVGDKIYFQEQSGWYQYIAFIGDRIQTLGGGQGPLETMFWQLYPVTFTEKKIATTLEFDNKTRRMRVGENYTNAAPILKDNDGHIMTPAPEEITYSVNNETLATIDAQTGQVTALATGTVTVTATYAGDATHSPSTATYIIEIFEEDPSNPLIDYTVDISGNASGRIYLDGNSDVQYKNGDVIPHTLLNKDQVSALNLSDYVYNISISEVIEGKATIKVNYASSYDWQINVILPGDFPDGTQINVSVMGKAYPMSYSGTNVIAPHPFTSTIGEMSSSFIRSTVVQGWVYTVHVHNYGDNDESFRNIYVTYSRYLYPLPEPGSFIRILNNNTGDYITSKENVVNNITYVGVDRSDLDRSIIYYDDSRRLLFYQGGQYISRIMGLKSIGEDGDVFTMDNNSGMKATVNLISNGMYIREFQQHPFYYATAVSDPGTDGYGDWVIESMSSIPVTITRAGHGYATLYSPKNLQMPSGVSAYVPVSRENGTSIEYVLTLKRINTGFIPKNTPVILYSAQAASDDITFSFPVHDEDDVAPISGRWDGLAGTCPAMLTTAGDYTLQPTNSANTVGFYPWDPSRHPSILPFKAYIPHAYTGAVNGFRFYFEDGEEATGLNELLAGEAEGEVVATRYYTADGRQVAAPVKGITIAVDTYADGTQKTRKYLMTK